MVSYFKEILVGFGSLLGGMAVTIRYFFKPIVTVQYPRELLIDDETGTHKCIACELCARTCPSQLITVKGVKLDAKKKVPWQYIIEYQYCSLCGLCLEVCPTTALEWSDEYRLANFNRQDSVIDILVRLQHQQRMAGVAVTPIPEPPAETEGEAKAEVKAEAKAEGEVKE
jgi:formate hydrogenlyase subunit 6/NADH:ubiquinone oxidoreductase subunit I